MYLGNPCVWVHGRLRPVFGHGKKTGHCCSFFSFLLVALGCCGAAGGGAELGGRVGKRQLDKFGTRYTYVRKNLRNGMCDEAANLPRLDSVWGREEGIQADKEIAP